jgi:MFS family permease
VSSGQNGVVPAGRRTALRTRRGVLTLLLLASVQFIVIIDSSIVNVALPPIQRSLHFSQQNLQWVVSGYLLTFGGFLLLGGRLGDLLGRRRMLFAMLFFITLYMQEILHYSPFMAGPATSPSLRASLSREVSRRSWSPASAPGS